MFFSLNVFEENGSCAWHIDTDVIIMCGRKDIFINLDENISFITKFNNDRNFIIKRKRLNFD